MAVNLFTGATDNNWGVATNWSQGTVPTASDGHTVTFDATSPDCTIDTTDRVFQNIDFTGYVNTITMTFDLELRGTSAIFSSGMNVSGSGEFRVNINSGVSITSNGYQWPNDFIYAANGGTLTLNDNLVVLGAFRHTNGSGTCTLTTGVYSISCNGLSTTSENILGTGSKIILTGGTWSSGGGRIIPNLDFQGNVTISGTVRYLTGRITYVSGTISWVSSASISLQGSCSLDTSGTTMQSLSTANVITVTLISHLYVGTFNIFSNTTLNRTATEIAYFSTSLLVNTGVTLGGSAELQLITGSTWSGSGTVNSYLNFNGNVTVSGSVTKGTSTLRRTSGTVTTTGSTLNLTSSQTLDTAGVTWNTITTSTTAGVTYTISSTLSAATLNLGLATTQTFAGTAGFDVNTLSCAAISAQTMSFKEGITYTVNNSFSCYQARVGSLPVFTSSHGTTKTIFNLPNNGSNQCNVLASFTRVDASPGRSITTFGGTITDCNNVVQYYDYKPVAL